MFLYCLLIGFTCKTSLVIYPWGVLHPPSNHLGYATVYITMLNKCLIICIDIQFVQCALINNCLLYTSYPKGLAIDQDFSTHQDYPWIIHGSRLLTISKSKPMPTMHSVNIENTGALILSDIGRIINLSN